MPPQTMRLIAKYIVIHLTNTFFSVSLVLTGIALGRQFVKLISQSSAGQIPPSLLFYLLSFELPELLSLLLPLALFLAVLITYGALYADQEIPVLLSCGASWWMLWRIPMALGCLVALSVLALQIYSPFLHYQKELTMNQLGISDRLTLLTPGRFQLIGGQRMVVYLEDMDENKEFSKVFIAEQPQGPNRTWSLLLAKQGRVQQEPNGYYLILEEGSRYEGVPGQADYHVTRFDRYGQLLNSGSTPVSLARRMMSFQDLARAGSNADWAEWQARVSLIISVFVLVVLAVPLSRVGRGQGRYARLLWGILLFIVYFNLLTFCRRLMISGVLPLSIGVWGIHAALLMLGLGWAFKQAGWPFWKISL